MLDHAALKGSLPQIAAVHYRPNGLANGHAWHNECGTETTSTAHEALWFLLSILAARPATSQTMVATWWASGSAHGYETRLFR